MSAPCTSPLPVFSFNENGSVQVEDFPEHVVERTSNWGWEISNSVVKFTSGDTFRWRKLRCRASDPTPVSPRIAEEGEAPNTRSLPDGASQQDFFVRLERLQRGLLDDDDDEEEE